MTIIKPSTYQRAAALAPRADDGDVIERLASKAQALAAVYGEPMTWDEARERARDNWHDVHQMAEMGAKG